ncbi:MAG: sulfatase-like hydrolase/transferase, partial [Planctomycetaceae bacterium]|nr:sulfatase-like hydrolase/transferase [Planctomycetaceae bacterium]
MQYPYHPNGRGFDEYYGFCSGHWGHYFSPILEHNGERVRGEGYVTDDFTNHALKFMEDSRKKGKPFFCYLLYCIPHSPMQVPDEFFEKFDGKTLEKRHRDPKQEEVPKTRAALAMCENIDWNVGRILKKLDEMSIAENTIVIYFSDNGPNSWRWNGGMKGRKGSTDEGGVRVPFVIKWPKSIPAGTKVPQIAGAIDLLPTLADLAEIPVQSENPLDGMSLKPLLTGAKVQWPDRIIFSHWNRKVSARNQQYRLDNNGQLFDMSQDPEQRKNVAGDNPKVAKRLQTALNQWKREVLSELKREDRPYTVGYSEFPITHLPARDGVPHGQIKRSARAPNCSFFTNWKSTEDSITWDLDVNTAGTYEATVYYTCKKSDVGCQIALDFQGAMAKAKVTEAHDPPLIGAKEDRVPRQGESYVKDFLPLSLGEIKLAKGEGKLTLKAIEIPGDAAIEVREIVLTLKP